MNSPIAREISLADILQPHHIIASMTCETKRQAISELLDVLVREGHLSDKDDALDRVIKREELASTDLGSGVAIPHARYDVGEKPVIAIARHKAGIDFGGSHAGLSHIIVLVLWQPVQTGLFNRLFAGLVTKLADPQFRDYVMSATTENSIAHLFSDISINLLAGKAPKWESQMLVALQGLCKAFHDGNHDVEDKIQLARAELTGSTLSRFDRLTAKFGNAVVTASSGICTGCNMQLSSGLGSEMQHHPDTVYVCERCGRFIVYQINDDV